MSNYDLITKVIFFRWQFKHYFEIKFVQMVDTCVSEYDFSYMYYSSFVKKKIYRYTHIHQNL